VAFANTETIVSSIYDGNSPYIVVSEDSVGSSAREPGIYGPNAAGEYLPLIKGHVLVGGVSKGIIQQFSITKENRRYPWLSVVDGKLYLYELGSADGTSQPSVIEIGSEQFPLVDVNGLHVDLPPITNISDVQVAAVDHTRDNQAFAISLRVPGASLFGDGITFVGFLASGLDQPSHAPLLHGPLTVIDYKFQFYSDLMGLFVGGNERPQAFSRLILQSTLARRGKAEASTLKAWREEIRGVLALLDRGQPVAIQPDLPVYDLVSEAPKLSVPPYYHVAQSRRLGGTQVCQVYDPLTGQDWVALDQDPKKQSSPSPTSLRGRLDFRPDESPYYFTSGDDTFPTALAEINGSLYLILPESVTGKAPMVLLLSGNEGQELPERLSYFALPIHANVPPPDFIGIDVFVSSVTKGVKATQVFKIARRNGVFSLELPLSISGEFYAQEELNARIRIKEQSGHVLFDNTTAPQKNVASYGQIARLTQPFLNITQTDNPSRPVQSYMAALSEKVLFGRQIVHKIYDPVGALQDQSGIYLYGPGTKTANRLSGELLEDVERLTREGLILGRRFKAKDKGQTHELAMAVVGVDAASAGGTNGFSLYAILTKYDDKEFSAAPVSFQQNIPFPFSRLKGVQLLIGANQHRRQLTLLVTVGNKENEGDRTEPGIYAIPMNYTISEDQSNQLTLEGEKMVPLSKETIDPAEMVPRLRADKDGQLYWVQNVGIVETSDKYTVTPLLGTNLSTIAPNRLGQKGVGWASQEQTRVILGLEKGADGDAFQEYGGDGKTWEVFSPYSFERLLGKLTVEKDGQQKIESYFKALGKKLEALASGEPQQTIFVVPENLKGDFITALRLHMESDEVPALKMSFRDNLMYFYYLDATESPSQSTVLHQIRLMRERTVNKKAMLIADAASIISLNRPADENPKVILQTAEFDGRSEPILPHLMYLLATDGRKAPLEEFGREQVPQSPVSKIIVATPAELQTIEEQAKLEVKSGLMRAFTINTDFLWTPWRVLSPESTMATAEIKRVKDLPVSELEREVFPNLIEQLEALSDVNRPAQHEVLLVPEELKALALKLILSRWAYGRGPVGAWDYRNPNLMFFRLNQGAPVTTQKDLIDNLSVMRTFEAGRKAFMLGELSDIRRLGRIVNELETNRFVISDWAEHEFSALIAGEDEERKKPRQPHSLYLLETEGREISPKEFVAEQESPNHKGSVLLIGTPQEWQAINRDIGTFENRFRLAERFHVRELVAPTLDKRRALLEKVATTPQIMSLNYRYDSGDLGRGVASRASGPGAEVTSLHKLIGYIANRAETLAKEFKQEITSAFIRVLSEFSRALAEDSYLRSSGVLDRAFAERLLSRVFSIPMNLNTLAPDDPLVRLSRTDAPLQMQSHGYEGPLELKAAVIRTILAQTRMDPVKTIPSSILVYGDTSTGKTALFRTLIKMMGLKEYDFSNPNDENADAMIINVGKLTTDENPTDGELMSVKTALAHVSHFLTLPRGYRGMILFDDEHKADEEVIAQIITFQQALFEAPGGMFRARSLSRKGEEAGEVREIPVRNIILGATINPTQDQEKIKRFKSTGDDIEMIMATLSGSKFALERSFFARWGLLLNLSKFPVAAKAPKLQQSLRNSSRNDFNVKGQFTVVSPAAVQKIVSTFPDANARDFLSVATSTLLNVRSDSQRGSLFVVVPANRLSSAAGGGWSATGTESARIEEEISKSSAAVPIEGRIDGKLQFLSILVDSLRTELYESLVSGVSQDSRYAGGLRQQRALLAPFLHALVANFTTKSFVSLSALNLDPYDFGAQSTLQQRDFRRALDQLVKNDSKFFPVQFYDEFARDGIEQSLTDSNFRDGEEKNRAQILTKYANKIYTQLVPFAEQMMRISSLSQLPDSNTWFQSLNETEVTAPKKVMGKQLADLFVDFVGEMYARDLQERREGNFSTVNTYDAVRFFLIAIDRAITKLPWGRIDRFMIDNLSRAASDMDLGQLPGVQFYLFNSSFSMVKPATHELAIQMAMSDHAYKLWSEEDAAQFANNFSLKCETMLVQGHSRRKAEGE
jgi:hypothetical protein